MVPLTMHESIPAGDGRSEPNSNPFLPEPKGRMNLSIMNPLASINELLGDDIVKKICTALLCALCLFAIAMLAPMVASNVVSTLLTK